MAAPLNEIFMKAPLKSLSLVVLVATVFQPPIAQANPSPLVKRSDAIFQQWTSVQDKFGCVDLPWTPITNPGFTRYEMAAAINACFDRVSEFVTGMNVAGMNGLPAASAEDVKLRHCVAEWRRLVT
jgi:hypothetical protein